MTRTALTLAAAALAIPTVATAAPKAVSGPTAVHATRYCVVETRVDSRLTSRTCDSLDGWLATGFDPRTRM